VFFNHYFCSEAVLYAFLWSENFSLLKTSGPGVISSMDANSNNPGASQAAAQQDPSSSVVAQSNVARDGLKCEWQGCGEQLPTAELLYVSKRMNVN